MIYKKEIEVQAFQYNYEKTPDWFNGFDFWLDKTVMYIPITDNNILKVYPGDFVVSGPWGLEVYNEENFKKEYKKVTQLKIVK